MCLTNHVDVIRVTRSDIKEIAETKEALHSKLQIRDVDHLQYFLGIEVLRQAEGIFLGQKTYALDLLKDTGLLGATPAKPPIEISLKLHPKEVSHQKTSRGIEDY